VLDEVAAPSTRSVKLPVVTLEPVPVPVNGRLTGEVRSELLTVSVAVRTPTAVGVKVMVEEQLAPGSRVVMAQGVVTAKSPGVDPIAMAVTAALPVLVRVTLKMAELLTATLPKLNAAGAI
jgi:hypothetical protein